MKKMHQQQFIWLTTLFALTGCINPSLSTSSSSTASVSSIDSVSSSIVSSISSSISSSSESSSVSSSSSLSSAEAGPFRLKIININDFHGAIETGDNYRGIARIGGYMLSEKAKVNQDTVIIANGDIFQGTALSYYYRGGTIVEAMNYVGIDAMTIGNHEFDWGVDDIQAYHDENPSNGEAEFPFLGANIYDRSTSQRVDWLDDYQIVDFGEYQVGIIGLIGYSLADSISTSIVSPYQFMSPTTVASTIATDLRVNHGVDFIIAALHDDNDTANQQLANLSGNARIDAILNGHSHYYYTETVVGSGSRQVPVIQSGSSGSHIGEIVFNIEVGTNPVYQSMRNLSVNSSLVEDATLVAMRDQDALAAASVIYEELGVAGESVDRYTAGNWAADVIKNAFADVDIAAVNMGGIRAAGFPIDANDIITYSSIFAIMPFDNYVKSVTLTGQQVVTIISSNTDSLVFDLGLTSSGGVWYIDGVAIVPTQNYRFATVDYIFDKTKYPFTTGINPEFSGILLRELLIEDVRLSGTNKWYPSNGAVITALPQ